MGLNDEMEKLRQAEEWLKGEPVESRYFRAAWDHVCFVYAHSENLTQRNRAAGIIKDMGTKLPGGY